VLAANEKWTGVTVHYVDARVDHGDIILQREVPILPGDTPESLHARIQEAEHVLYPEALEQVFRDLRSG
jgi:phosphoribosylglycinamide formyltransferase-1